MLFSAYSLQVAVALQCHSCSQGEEQIQQLQPQQLSGTEQEGCPFQHIYLVILSNTF